VAQPHYKLGGQSNLRQRSHLTKMQGLPYRLPSCSLFVENYFIGGPDFDYDCSQMARIIPAELQDPSHFRLFLALAHANILPFVEEYYLARRNWVIWIHYLLSVISLGAVFWAGIAFGSTSADWFRALGLAVVAFIILIPLHEGIHGLVYLLLGARDVRFGGSLRIMAFYALAHDFVVAGSELAWLALAPFLIINGALIILAVASPGLRLFALVLSLLHLTAVSGDWAILGFLWEHRVAPVFTYDDAESRISYFYQKDIPL
jgi:hypothetical protein